MIGIYSKLFTNQVMVPTANRADTRATNSRSVALYHVTLPHSTNVKDTQLATILLTLHIATPQWLL